MKQNISPEILIQYRTITLAAGEIKQVPVSGMRQFVLRGNSSATVAQICVGSKGDFQDWPLLYAYTTPQLDQYFDQITFRNNSAGPMTLTYVVSNGLIDNKSAEIIGTALVDFTSNGISTPASIVVQPRSILIDIDEPVDVGGGVVGIPVTGHPFTIGDSIVISGCVLYNGTYTVLASTGVNQVDITAVFQGGLVDNAAAVNVGGGVVGIPITGHPYTPGETIRLAGTVNYNADYVVLGTTGANQVDITAAYVAEVFTGAETHNLVFDGVNDYIGRTTAQVIPGDGTRKELHITNHDTTYKVLFGDSNVNADTPRGVVIQPDSVYILTCTDDIYLACEGGAGVAGCVVSWANLTKT